MENVMDFLQSLASGNTTPRKTVAPTKQNLNRIRAEVRIEASKPVDILSAEFNNRYGSNHGGRIIMATIAPAPAPDPKPSLITVIMPGDNKPPKIVPTHSQAHDTKPAPLQIVKYSEVSFAVFGTTDPKATKQYKEDLQSLGGKYNNWLKKDGKPTPGYIYPMWRLDHVKRYMERF